MTRIVEARLPARHGWPLAALAAAQVVLGLRAGCRLARTARGTRISASNAALPDERVSVIVPVLNERKRLPGCLDGLTAQPDEVAEILVIDGGSSDGTPELVGSYAARDARVRLVAAGPIPPHWNGKAYGLQVGFDYADPASGWLLTIDADVRPSPTLARSLLGHARTTGDAVTSIATEQHLSGSAEAVVHPALLTTLVYRFGIPGHATHRVNQVQANGQCCLFRRKPLATQGGFRVARVSRCEDVTIARALAARGHAVGFYEAGGLATVEMYADWHDAWRNWPRSLPMLDQYVGFAGWLGLAEVTLVQALPLIVSALIRRPGRAGGMPLVAAVNGALAAMRVGVLIGTARAYPGRPRSYWLSPLADLPATLQLWRSATRRRHEWRGRLLVNHHPGKSA